MQARAARLLGDHPMRAWISTFHSLCVRLLRREAAAAGLPPEFLIYDEDDQLAAVREAMRALDVSEKLHPPRRLLSRISARKNSGRGATDEDDARPRADRARAGALHGDPARGGRARLRRPAAARAGSCSSATTDVREAWQRRFPYVLVDEYQDTNRVQYDLVRLLAGPAGQPDRRRRRGPVDLLLARRRHPEHPRLRARLPGRAGVPAGGELPLAAERARRGRGPRLAQRPAQGQDAAGRARRRRRGAAARGARRVLRGRLGGRAHGGPARAGPGGGPDAHERPEPALRGGPAAGADPLPGRGRRRLLRAQGGQGPARLPAAAREPARLRRAAPGGERPPARDRGEDGRGDRPRRPPSTTRAPGTRSCG